MTTTEPIREKLVHPSVTMREFFAIPAVAAAQQVQKCNPYGSESHRRAFDSIKAEAAKYGVSQFIGDYED